MGTNYQRFADALDNIKTSNLSSEDRQLESERVKGARINAYLECQYLPGVLEIKLTLKNCLTRMALSLTARAPKLSCI